MPNIKKSYGLICFRKNTQGSHELIMIKKSVTYYFCEFVSGRYVKNDDTRLITLFNNMTYHEKIDILNLNFENLWYRIYKKKPDSGDLSTYLKKKNKFEETFLKDGGKRLRKLMSYSVNVDTPWEFPKGRKDTQKREQDLDTAIREFTEETGINSEKYKILWHIIPYVETYMDFEVTYQNVYFYAQAVGVWEPELKFYDKEQIGEISDVKWISRADLRHIKLEALTYQRLLKSFDKIIKKYRKGTKSI